MTPSRASLRRDLRLTALSVRALRNLAEVDLAPCPRFNVISGDNGQGKTNLLEAIYLWATSRSFRTAKLADVVALGETSGSVRGEVSDDGVTREQSVGLSAGARTVRIDGKRPPSLAAYAVRSPVVVFHPGEMSLSMGAGGERRRLLDRLALYLERDSLEELDRYTRAQRSRQKALESRGTSAADLSEWEQLMAVHGVAVTLARARTAARLAPVIASSFARIGAPGVTLSARYAPSAPSTVDEFSRELRARRERDRVRGAATMGPHRDDLSLELDARPVRGLASQGQHRAVVLSLKSAEVDVIAEARGVQAMLLLDDVSSELDRARTSALFAFLRDHQGQVFLSTTRPELIDTDGAMPGVERLDWAIESGRLRAL